MAPTNLPASVEARLRSLALERGEDVAAIRSRYAIERLLYRISQSPHATRFVLKGSNLFAAWTGQMHRPTKDADFLAFGDPSIESIAQTIREVCRLAVVPDGLTFVEGSVEADRIKEDQEYEGVRVRLFCHLAKPAAQIRVQLDFGFGDAVQPVDADYPAMLDFPAPRLRAYPREAVMAEKLHAVVTLGETNTRMKDFYDLWTMANQFDFDGPVLLAAVRATFDRRRTAFVDAVPMALAPEFYARPDKAALWGNFIANNGLTAPAFPAVGEQLRAFALPVYRMGGMVAESLGNWKAGVGW